MFSVTYYTHNYLLVFPHSSLNAIFYEQVVHCTGQKASLIVIADFSIHEVFMGVVTNNSLSTNMTIGIGQHLADVKEYGIKKAVDES